MRLFGLVIDKPLIFQIPAKKPVNLVSEQQLLGSICSLPHGIMALIRFISLKKDLILIYKP